MNDSIATHIQAILKLLGEDPARQGLLKTPQRVEDAYAELTRGYIQNAGEILSEAVFDEPYNDFILVRDISFFSLCEHHLLPFFGHAHVAYIPDTKIVGLSKLPRIVDVFARRLQVQERLTAQIHDAIVEHLNPKGVIVIAEAQHMCMAMRGVQKQGSCTVTRKHSGLFSLPQWQDQVERRIR